MRTKEVAYNLSNSPFKIPALIRNICRLNIKLQNKQSIWIALHERYEGDKKKRIIEARNDVSRLIMKKEENWEEYLYRSEKLLEQARNLGAEIEDQEFTTSVIRGLPQKYNLVALQLNSQMKVSISDLKNCLKLYHERFTHEEKEGNSKAFNTIHKESFSNSKHFHKNRNGNKPICFICAKPGHKAIECWHNPKNNRGSENKQTSKNKPEHQNKAKFVNLQPEEHVSNIKEYETTQQPEEWVVDSGASCHMTSNRDLLKEEREVHKTIKLADDSEIISNAEGAIEIEGQNKLIRLNDVLYVEKLSGNLMSVNKLVDDNKKVLFDKDGGHIMEEDGEEILMAQRINDFYIIKTSAPEEIPSQALKATLHTWNDWHKRLGHLNEEYMKQMLKNNSAHNFNTQSQNMDTCQVCIQAKHPRTPFKPVLYPQSTRPLDLIHIDLIGPIQEESIGGAKYVLTLVDDFSRKIFVEFLSSKLETFDIIRSFIEEIEKEKEIKVKQLRSDNGKEFTNHQMTQYLKGKGIKHQLTNVYTPQQNGISEKYNRTLIEGTRALLIDSQLPLRYWAETMSTFAYLKNRTPCKKLGWITPEERFSNRKPTVAHLKIFGCIAYYYVHKHKRGKFQPTAKAGIFVGYSSTRKAWRLIGPENENVIETRDVKFLENKLGKEILNKNDSDDTQKYFLYNFPEETIPETSEEVENHDDHSHSDFENQDEHSELPYNLRPNLKDKLYYELSSDDEPIEDNEDKDPTYDPTVGALKLSHGNLLPSSYEEAINHPDSPLWQQAMDKEIHSLQNHHVWDLTELPEGAKAIKSKWIFSKKMDPQTNQEIYKARLVALGCSQEYGTDYTETFSPVMKTDSFRTLLAYATMAGYEFHHFDVETAFLYGKLSETIYMTQPPGYQDDKKKTSVCILNQALYGLKQSGRVCGNGTEDCGKWMKDYERIARSNCWDATMKLANAPFFLEGTAGQWYDNNEEGMDSWDRFKEMFSRTFDNSGVLLRRAKDNLQSRAQKSTESCESYIQDVLSLCRQVNPDMSQGEKVAHLMKGVVEDVYQVILIKEIDTVEAFVDWCRKVEACKQRRIGKPRFERLPNVASIEQPNSSSLEDLIRRIVREEIKSALHSEPIVPEVNSLKKIIHEEVERNLTPIAEQGPYYREQRRYFEGPAKPTPYYQQQSPTRLTTARRKTDEWRTVDNIPVVADPQLNVAPRYRQADDLADHLIVRKTRASALRWSGASFSVISDHFRQQHKKTMFSDAGMTLRVADGKYLVSRGRCTLRLEINGLVQPFEFIVLPSCSHDIILGWDFLEASRAIIDCGSAEILLEKAELPEDSSSIFQTVAADDSFIIPAGSTKQINVITETILGVSDVVMEPSRILFLEHDLMVPASIFAVQHGKGRIWITNIGTCDRTVPKGMCIGEIQVLEEGQLAVIGDASDTNRQEILGQENSPNIASMISPDLSMLERTRICSILGSFSGLFEFNKFPSNLTSTAKHKINTEDHPPIKRRPYRVSQVERQTIQNEVDKMLKGGIVQLSESPWSSPVVLVKKKNGSWRFCVDYRHLNKITKKDVYPLPRIDDTLDCLRGASYYSSMDLRSGYWQIEVDEADREKTAFITPDGLYEFKVMPSGLCNAPATFERMMDTLLRGLKWSMCLCYLDDIIVFSPTFDEHVRRLELVLRCLSKAGLVLNPDKCLFGTKRISIFGHLVDGEGVHPDPGKVDAMSKFPTPKSLTDVRSFIGMCSYYRRFIKNFAQKAEPLHRLLRKDTRFEWGPDQRQAYESLKLALASEPVLAHFDEKYAAELHTDASGFGIGAVLVQVQGGSEKPIGYASRTLSTAEKNYSTTERECLAAIWAIGKFRPYLFGRSFTIVTDHHSLCWLSGLKDPSGRLARWALRLQEYNVNVAYKNGRKHQDADCLSRNPIEANNPGESGDDIPTLSALTDIVAEQRKDPVIVRISEECLKNDQNRFKIINGALYKRNFDPVGQPWLLVIPRHLRPDVLRSLHDNPTAGHLGLAKTHDRIRRKYFWPGLLRSIRKYVGHCRECQRRKHAPLRPPGLLQPIPPTSVPFQRVGIDLLGRFPISHLGNKWIIVCTDYLTRYAITRALPSADAQQVAKFVLEDVVLKHGAPREIITDRGRVFQSKLISELTGLCSSAQRFTTAYHPQTNGLTERLNKTLADMMSMYVDVEQKEWDVILPFITFAYNTAKQDTTGFTPFSLIHGREAETTLDTLFPLLKDEDQEDYNREIVTRAEETRQLARLHTLRAQEGNKRLYDAKHREMSYQPGDKVWIFIPVRKIGISEKLIKRYFGPYRVTRRISDVTYEVESLDTTNRRRKPKEIVHVVRMKNYRDPDEQLDLPEDEPAV
ncbi:K02A2.6-like [Cordylochernes scorpioides]|uniref:RNA-directed DNA polymerase n=1 Tax=Cordylochernes scorpioides TaxID=51811 RepID=A0ABY6KQ94_9ARAC|nr:K02A2.6-like [Cordylochernes scorpioides]